MQAPAPKQVAVFQAPPGLPPPLFSAEPVPEATTALSITARLAQNMHSVSMAAHKAEHTGGVWFPPTAIRQLTSFAAATAVGPIANGLGFVAALESAESTGQGIGQTLEQQHLQPQQQQQRAAPTQSNGDDEIILVPDGCALQDELLREQQQQQQQQQQQPQSNDLKQGLLAVKISALDIEMLRMQAADPFFSIQEDRDHWYQMDGLQVNANDLDKSILALEWMVANIATGEETSRWSPDVACQALAKTTIFEQVAAMVRSFQRALSTAINFSHAGIVKSLIKAEIAAKSTPYDIEMRHLGKGRAVGDDLCNHLYIEERRAAMQKENYGEEVIQQALCQQDPYEFTSGALCRRDAIEKIIQQCTFLATYPALDRDPTMMPHEIRYHQLTRIFSNVPHILMGQHAVAGLRHARAEYAAIGRLERLRANPNTQLLAGLVAGVPSLPAVLQDNVEPRKNPNKITPGTHLFPEKIS